MRFETSEGVELLNAGYNIGVNVGALIFTLVALSVITGVLAAVAIRQYNATKRREILVCPSPDRIGGNLVVGAPVPMS